MKVTVQDVLDAGGKLKSGDPVYLLNGDKVELNAIYDGPLHKTRGKEDIAVLYENGSLQAVSSRETFIRIDDITFLKINDTIYRVTGHNQRRLIEPVAPSNCLCEYTDEACAIYEPLIPDPPKQEYPNKIYVCCPKCGHVSRINHGANIVLCGECKWHRSESLKEVENAIKKAREE